MLRSTLVGFGSGICCGIVICAVAKRMRSHWASLSRASDDIPEWLQPLFASGTRVWLREWEDDDWRRRNGWVGSDLCHNRSGQAVRVLDYFFDAQSESLTGIVSFGPDAESHRGLCHGGAMTSAMDDALGHITFFAGDGPWQGATVQVNTKLQKPVQIGQLLKLEAKIVKREGRKVHVAAQLVDSDGSVYASMEGLSIAGVKLGEHDDAVSRRRWIPSDDGIRDSGWTDSE